MKLIKNWKKSWKFLSTQLSVVIAVLTVVGGYFQMVDSLAATGIFIMAVAVPLLRIVDQNINEDEDESIK